MRFRQLHHHQHQHLQQRVGTRNIPPIDESAFEMGKPIPKFLEDAENDDVTQLVNASRRRPPPLDLSQVPDTETVEWFGRLFENLHRLLREAEDKFPALAQWHRAISEVLADTPPPRGDEVWIS